jgi:hydrogenase maturation protease
VTALVVGIGNTVRGDDGVGPEVAARVAALSLPGVEVLVCEEPLALVEHLGAYDEVVVVDATSPRGAPGRVEVREVGSGPLARDTAVGSSHGLGVAEAVELARALGRLPRRLTLVGVEGLRFQVGDGVSGPVRERVDEAARAVVEALARAHR